MATKPESTTEVLTLRVPRDIALRLAREARRQRRTRSEVARTILAAGLGEPAPDPMAEARRQSMLVSARDSEREALQFIIGSADLRGWS